MAAPSGNEFWRNRSKHGRDKLFTTPELLWEAACEYFEWCVKNPWFRHEAIKGGDLAGQTIKVPIDRPFTLGGLCLYLGCNENYFRAIKSQGRENVEEFLTVISDIEQTVYNQKFEGAAVGTFNANIIARDLGLTDKQDVTSKGESIKALQIEIVHTKDTGEQST